MNKLKRSILVVASFVLVALLAGNCGDDFVTETDEDDEDDVTATTFDRTIAISFGGEQASVSGDVHGIVSVNGNYVTVNNTTDEKVVYDLSGATNSGSFKLYSSRKQAIRLHQLDLTNPKGAAINNQSKKRTFVVVEGSNSLADGKKYTKTEGEDEKAAFFSEGQLVFSGAGSLAVTARGKAGITSDDYVRFLSSPTIKVNTTAGHAVCGKDAIIVSGGNLDVTTSADTKKGFSSDSLVRIDGGVTHITVKGSAEYDSKDNKYTGTAGIKADKLFEMLAGELVIHNSGTGGKGISCDGPGCFKGGTVTVTTTGANFGSSNETPSKGIKFDGDLSFSGATVSVTSLSHEGISSKGTIDISGGVLYVCASDDAINSHGDLTINGGYVCAWSTDNDGIDANGNLYVKGGTVYAVGTHTPEVALDANTDDDKKLYILGGTIIAIGGLERDANLSQKCYWAPWSKNTWYGLTIGLSTFAFQTPSSGGDTLVVSGVPAPALKSGVSVSGGTNLFDGLCVRDAIVSGGISVNLSNYSSGSNY
ncbi:MAG: carbohydrate-binding domain-containing protein [Bacteroidales bacterium]|nr:carbohydrate-binding domain-containing protein [Bacteroidales bacterium]